MEKYIVKITQLEADVIWDGLNKLDYNDGNINKNVITRQDYNNLIREIKRKFLTHNLEKNGNY